ncbi:porin [Roseateles koreensis]|uniref:Porin n=1 Tax=Roseateles koreensis TaxID=2987526 RepID=A0ABT5KUM0_9BURK|nr:porin [Roseateles koreensis]MDC8786645.1 porin [Roseateles koreensis]
MTKLIPSALLVGGLIASCAGTSFAQSSVQIAGQLGVGVGVKNHQGPGDGSVTEVTDNLMKASWLRISGIEDLGGGMSAMFRLESGLSADTGTAGGTGQGATLASPKFWNRNATVGLRWADIGVLSAGRQFHSSTDRAIETLDVNQLSAAHVAYAPVGYFGVNRYNGFDTRVDNSIKFRYKKPNVIEFGFSAAPGEGTAGRNYSAEIAHTSSTLNVGAIFAHFDANAQLANGHKPAYEFWGIGGNVKFGSVQPYIAYYHNALDSATLLGRPQQVNEIISLGVAWDASAQTRFTAAYYNDRGTGLNNVLGRDGTKNTWILAGYYYLSKRTELYVAAHNNAFLDGYRLETVNLSTLNRTASEGRVSGLSTGIRHNF